MKRLLLCLIWVALGSFSASALAKPKAGDITHICMLMTSRSVALYVGQQICSVRPDQQEALDAFINKFNQTTKESCINSLPDARFDTMEIMLHDYRLISKHENDTQFCEQFQNLVNTAIKDPIAPVK